MSLKQLYSLMIALLMMGFFSYYYLQISPRQNNSKRFETKIASMNRMVDVGVLNLWDKLRNDFSVIEETLRTESLMGALDIDFDELQKKWSRLEKANVMCQESLDIECRQKVIQQLLLLDENVRQIGEKTNRAELLDRSLAHRLSTYQEKLERIKNQQEHWKEIQQRHRDKIEVMRDRNERILDRNRSRMESLRDKNEAQKDKMQALRDRMERMKKY